MELFSIDKLVTSYQEVYTNLIKAKSYEYESVS
jgi:hypothetical protein